MLIAKKGGCALMSQLIILFCLNCFSLSAQPGQAATKTSQAGITFVAPVQSTPTPQVKTPVTHQNLPATSDAGSWQLALAGVTLIGTCLVWFKEARDA